MLCRFYEQVTYNEQLQTCVSIDTNARVPAEGSMYVIFHEPTKRYFRYKPTINHFKLTEAKDCNWTTRYLLCKHLMFTKMTDQTKYIRQNRTELKQDHGQMISQRHDSYDPNTMQNEYLEKLGMRYSQDEDCDPHKQKYYRQIQEKPTIEKWAN